MSRAPNFDFPIFNSAEDEHHLSSIFDRPYTPTHLSEQFESESIRQKISEHFGSELEETKTELPDMGQAFLPAEVRLFVTEPSKMSERFEYIFDREKQILELFFESTLKDLVSIFEQKKEELHARVDIDKKEFFRFYDQFRGSVQKFLDETVRLMDDSRFSTSNDLNSTSAPSDNPLHHQLLKIQLEKQRMEQQERQIRHIEELYNNSSIPTSQQIIENFLTRHDERKTSLDLPAIETNLKNVSTQVSQLIATISSPIVQSNNNTNSNTNQLNFNSGQQNFNNTQTNFNTGQPNFNNTQQSFNNTQTSFNNTQTPFSNIHTVTPPTRTKATNREKDFGFLITQTNLENLDTQGLISQSKSPDVSGRKPNNQLLIETLIRPDSGLSDSRPGGLKGALKFATKSPAYNPPGMKDKKSVKFNLENPAPQLKGSMSLNQQQHHQQQISVQYQHSPLRDSYNNVGQGTSQQNTPRLMSNPLSLSQSLLDSDSTRSMMPLLSATKTNMITGQYNPLHHYALIPLFAEKSNSLSCFDLDDKLSQIYLGTKVGDLISLQVDKSSLKTQVSLKMNIQVPIEKICCLPDATLLILISSQDRSLLCLDSITFTQKVAYKTYKETIKLITFADEFYFFTLTNENKFFLYEKNSAEPKKSFVLTTTPIVDLVMPSSGMIFAALENGDVKILQFSSETLAVSLIVK